MENSWKIKKKKILNPRKKAKCKDGNKHKHRSALELVKETWVLTLKTQCPVVGRLTAGVVRFGYIGGSELAIRSVPIF